MADRLLVPLYARRASAYRMPGRHDPDSKRLVTLVLCPPTRANSTVYYRRSDDDFDVVIPATFTGVYFSVVNPGKSDTAEPTFDYEIGQTTEDGTTGLVWKANAYNFIPPTVTVSSATFTANNGVTLSSTSNTTTECTFKTDAIGSTAAARTDLEFTVKVHVTLSNGEEYDISVDFFLGEQ